MALLIYLADLTHIGNGDAVATEAFPLNIGLISSYAKKKYGDKVDIKLFKYPQKLLSALKQSPPDILGCSNYTWNSNLSLYFTKMAKSVSPSTLTVWGGTNYPFSPESQEEFLRARPDLDLHVYYEGEYAFSELIERVLRSEVPCNILDNPLRSCQFIHPSSGNFISGEPIVRTKELDQIPSPYTNGTLDQFFDGVLTPLVETARGCPFQCNFCNAGDKYYNKVSTFGNDYVKEELTYIAKLASENEVGHITFADNNYGMIPRDAITTQVVHNLREQYGWPKTMTVWTGKNAKERVIDVTRLMGDTIQISMSVQSMDPEVLKNITRENIKIDHYKAIAEDLDQQGRRQHAEVIMPLPGETLESHISGLNELLDTKVSTILSHTLQMLHGTPYKDDSTFIKEHKYVTKYRLVPLDFSRIGDDYIFDIEGVAVQSKYMTFDQYLAARVYLLQIDLCFNSKVFAPLIRLLHSYNITISSWISHLFGKQEHISDSVQKVFDNFLAETKNELWDSEEELVKHYNQPEIFNKLIKGDIGGNVLYKHRIWIMAKASTPFVEDVFKAAALLVPKSATDELQDIKEFVLGTISNCYAPETVDQIYTKTFNYDVNSWLESNNDNPLAEFKLDAPIEITFELDQRDRAALKDAFQRYRTDISGMVKLVQRINRAIYRKPLSPSIAAKPQENYGSNVGRVSL